jgi:uncharacterized membrane protein YozB (DUF420 family)/cytochrome oxidase Cu insertion factor (SCO1/SenC/PrrC family)
VALGLGAAVCVAFLAWSGRVQGPRRYGALPAFRLLGHDGSVVSLDSLAGRPWVADFIFTRCGSVCPGMTTAMAGLQRIAPAELRFVSFTVDPVHDTPGVLARYAAAHHAGPGWAFVTGPERDIYDLAVHGFRLTAGRDEGAPGEGDTQGFDHSAKFALVDGNGVVRGYYDSDDAASRRRLLRDAALVGRLGALPRLNATLNAASAALLALGFLLVRQRRLADHRNCMIAALLTSALFLSSYLVYHWGVGSIRFSGEGALRTFYLGLLASHTILAVFLVPLVALTFLRALRQRFDRHRRLARVTLPVWAYVSVTGVVVYAMLYLA